MRRVFKSRVFKSVISSLMFMNSYAFANDFNKLDKLIDLLEKEDKAMLAVAVRQNGKLIYESYSGLASSRENEKVNVNSIYRIGSISKIFTAVLVMQAVEQGKVSLDSKLNDFYSDIPNSDVITVRHLLSHRSGIFNFTDDPAYAGYMTQTKSRLELINIIKSYESQFTPGSQHGYSNSNYVLLTMILEQVYKQDFSEIVENQIIKPLKLKNTYLGQSTRNKNEVSSFAYAGNWISAPVTDMSIPLGAGSMISNARDVTAFLTALFQHKLVSEKSLQEMKTLHQGYGLGLMSFPFYDKNGYGHNGGIDGFTSNTAFIEEDDLAICVLSNGLNYNFNDVLIAVLSSHYKKPFDLPNFDAVPVQLTVTELQKFVGDYESKQLPLDIKVFLKENKLMAQATGQGAFPLETYENEELRFDPAGIVIKFIEDKSGFQLNQGGGLFNFSRK